MNAHSPTTREAPAAEPDARSRATPEDASTSAAESPPGEPAPREAPPREVELKLELAPADWARLSAEPFVAEALAAAPRAKRLESTYFDTTDRRLRAKGVSLRIRKSGAKRIQTAKLADAAAGGLYDRAEYETPVTGDTPLLGAFDGTPLEAIVGKRKVREGLVPVFVVGAKRRSFTLSDGDATAEATIDEGVVTAGERTEPLCELELELRAGEPAGLFRIARRIAETVPARLGFRTKADRGYALAAGEAPQIVKKIEVALDPEVSAGDAFRAIARACLAQLVANEPALRDLRAPGAVHQSRVALRRLRAAISLFKRVVDDEARRAISSELKWMAGRLGDARDLDVYIATAVEPARAARPDDPDLARVADAFAARREIAYDEALAAATSGRYRLMLIDTVAWVEAGDWTRGEREIRETPIGEFAAALLKKRAKRIRKDGAKLETLDPETRHEVRIEVKKLRYAVEFFESVFVGEDGASRGKKAAKRHAAMLAQLEALQEDLGALNDIAVGGEMAAGFPEPDEALARGLAALERPDGSATAAEHLRAARKAYDRFVEAKPFWS